jgi:hypothetical protein
MKYLRWALGVLLAFYGLWTLYPLGMTAAHKLGRLGEIPTEAQRFIPLMVATPWWQVALWAVGVGLYLATAVRLFRGGRALTLFGGAFVVDLANMAIMRSSEVYARTFTADELAMDYYVVAFLVAAGLAIWWSERGRSAPTATA